MQVQNQVCGGIPEVRGFHGVERSLRVGEDSDCEAARLYLFTANVTELSRSLCYVRVGKVCIAWGRTQYRGSPHSYINYAQREIRRQQL